MDLAKKIASELGFQQQSYQWVPIYFNSPPQRKNSPLDNWAWDMLPMYCVSFLFLQERASKNELPKKGECLLQICITADTGYDDGSGNEPNPLDFETAENSNTMVDLLVI